ncbi:MAG: ABC transporter permease [Gammaproteobacteria bacterium]|nr:ABC transporter permease [Gammaproteobacteria bacterium]
MTSQEIHANPALAELDCGSRDLLIRISGSWSTGDQLPVAETFIASLPDTGSQTLSFNTSGINRWDSRFVSWVIKVTDAAEARGIPVGYQGLPAGVQGLIKLAKAVPEHKASAPREEASGLLTRIGHGVHAFVDQTGELLAFLGEVFLAFTRMLTGKARFRGGDLLLYIQQTGVDALPIVGLISILVGLILAFIGAIQLAMFGAQIYIANLVGIAMVREMGAMMAAVIMAGRTGAAFSAQLGSMQVNEEIDAFKTLGIDPVEFLVLPRILALTLMLPLLCLYADLLGILGGAMVGTTLFDISLTLYVEQTISSISLADVMVGVVKSGVFGILIALAGCVKGMHCGRSASSVGDATTAAVVMSIVAVVVADAVMTLINNAIGV